MTLSGRALRRADSDQEDFIDQQQQSDHRDHHHRVVRFDAGGGDTTTATTDERSNHTSTTNNVRFRGDHHNVRFGGETETMTTTNNNSNDNNHRFSTVTDPPSSAGGRVVGSSVRNTPDNLLGPVSSSISGGGLRATASAMSTISTTVAQQQPLQPLNNFDRTATTIQNDLVSDELSSSLGGVGGRRWVRDYRREHYGTTGNGGGSVRSTESSGNVRWLRSRHHPTRQQFEEEESMGIGAGVGGAGNDGGGGMSSFHRRVERRATWFEEQEVATTFPTDVFTMIIFAHPLSWPFLYASLVFLFQINIVVLILIDLTDSEEDRRPVEGFDQNLLNVPPFASLEVRIAQVMAILIATLSNTDVTQSMEILSVGWKPFLKDRFPDATRGKFIIANLLRIYEGACVIVASFIFTVQATNVLDIFLNFAAVEFVANLDDLGYQIARGGWVGRDMKQFNASIEDIEIPAAKKKTDWLLMVKPILVAFLLICLYSVYAGVAIRQGNGAILENTSCGSVNVEIGEEVYVFNGNIYFETARAEIMDQDHGDEDEEFFNGGYWSIVHGEVVSGRVLGTNFNASRAPNLRYAYFSGEYVADFQDLEDNRPTYYEDDFHDITAGMFYYCDKERSWVFTIRAFETTGAIPPSNMKNCKFGWLMRSPVTDAFTLDQAPMDGWKVWTGVLEPVSDFSVVCTECFTDLDCGTAERGTCLESRRCECNSKIAQGFFCAEDVSCDDLVLFEGTDAETQGTTYPSETSSQRTYRKAKTLYGDAKFHERSIFYLERPGMVDRYEVILYSGRRWYDSYFTARDLPLGAAEGPKKEAYFEHFHAYWHDVLFGKAQWISEVTGSQTPVGPLQWYGFHVSLSRGSYGVYPLLEEVNQRFECYNVDCEILNVCGREAKCERREPIYESDGYLLEGNHCVCGPLFTGHFCEYCVDLECSAVPDHKQARDEPITAYPSTLSPTPRPTKAPLSIPTTKPKPIPSVVPTVVST